MKSSLNPVVLALLDVPALLYGLVVRSRQRIYRLPGAVSRVEIPVVSIGNLTVGGTGKTTIVAWLARELTARGHHPAVVTRGYKGRAGRGPLFVSRGRGPLVTVAVAGDEPFLLARDLEGTMIVAGSDRVAGARAARQAGADVVILDDGFQHLRLARDLDVVLLDAHSPFGNYRLLPAGSLREPASGLQRADLVLITRSRAGESFAVLERVVRRYAPQVPILRASHRASAFVDAGGRPVERPPRAVAFCGIGNPYAFLTDLEAEGVQVAQFRAFRDHHAFTTADCRELAAAARHYGGALLTTEKDIVRLPAAILEAPEPRVVAMRIEAVVHDREHLMESIGRVL